jgi:glycosyltransferase involved in cell wall biosynthesis
LTEAARADLMRRGISGDVILVSPGSTVDPDRFRPAPDRQAWVVFAGRLVDEKNPLLFLEAVPAIHRAEPTARFFLLGEGPLRSQVEEALDRSALRGVVEVGFRPDLASVLGKARVFVSLQRQDNYPSQSLLEAMACGAAAVATDVGLTWKLVDEATGIRVKPNPDDIAEAVIRLLRDPQRCDRLGQAARRRVQEAHSEDRYRAYLDELYAKVAM